MGKLFAAGAAALFVVCIGGWAVSGMQAPATLATVQIDPFEMMTSANQLPIEHFADYSFVF
jgi:hypothetical protein